MVSTISFWYSPRINSLGGCQDHGGHVGTVSSLLSDNRFSLGDRGRLDDCA
jgi:hypothetical protein